MSCFFSRSKSLISVMREFSALSVRSVRINFTRRSVTFALTLKGSNTCYSAPLQASPTAEARTKQRRTYNMPYTFPAVAGTHLPTPKGWRVEQTQAQGANSNWPTPATRLSRHSLVNNSRWRQACSLRSLSFIDVKKR